MALPVSPRTTRTIGTRRPGRCWSNMPFNGRMRSCCCILIATDFSTSSIAPPANSCGLLPYMDELTWAKGIDAKGRPQSRYQVRILRPAALGRARAREVDPTGCRLPSIRRPAYSCADCREMRHLLQLGERAGPDERFRRRGAASGFRMRRGGSTCARSIRRRVSGGGNTR